PVICGFNPAGLLSAAIVALSQYRNPAAVQTHAIHKDAALRGQSEVGTNSETMTNSAGNRRGTGGRDAGGWVTRLLSSIPTDESSANGIGVWPISLLATSPLDGSTNALPLQTFRIKCAA